MGKAIACKFIQSQLYIGMMSYFLWGALYLFFGLCWAIAVDGDFPYDHLIALLFWWIIIPAKIVIAIMRLIIKLSKS